MALAQPSAGRNEDEGRRGAEVEGGGMGEEDEAVAMAEERTATRRA